METAEKIDELSEFRDAIRSVIRAICISIKANEWPETKEHDWLFGIFLGFDIDDQFLREVTEKNGWSEDEVASLMCYRRGIQTLMKKQLPA